MQASGLKDAAPQAAREPGNVRRAVPQGKLLESGGKSPQVALCIEFPSGPPMQQVSLPTNWLGVGEERLPSNTDSAGVAHAEVLANCNNPSGESFG